MGFVLPPNPPTRAKYLRAHVRWRTGVNGERDTTSRLNLTEQEMTAMGAKEAKGFDWWQVARPVVVALFVLAGLGLAMLMQGCTAVKFPGGFYIRVLQEPNAKVTIPGPDGEPQAVLEYGVETNERVLLVPAEIAERAVKGGVGS